MKERERGKYQSPHIQLQQCYAIVVYYVVLIWFVSSLRSFFSTSDRNRDQVRKEEYEEHSVIRVIQISDDRWF